MRRVNVHLDDQLDADLSQEAQRTGRSRASLLREAARAFLGQQAETVDPWARFTGAITDVTVDELDDDDVVYR